MSWDARSSSTIFTIVRVSPSVSCGVWVPSESTITPSASTTAARAFVPPMSNPTVIGE